MENQINYFVNKAFMKQMDKLSDIDLKAWLDVPELSKKDQLKAFKIIRNK